MAQWAWLSALVLVALPACAHPTGPHSAPAETIAPMAAGAHDARIGDITMHYTVDGVGPPLILLHGGWQAGDQWDPLIPMLSSHFTIIRPDSRGRGRSGDSDAPITYARVAHDVIGLMQYLKLPRARVAGHSDGAVVALHLLVDYPDHVENAVLAGVAANIVTDGLYEGMQEYARLADQLAPGATPSPMLAAFRDRWMMTAPDTSRFEDVVAKLAASWSTSPTFESGELATIKRPVCIIRAGQDELIPVAAYDRLHHLIPGSTVVDAPNASHRVVRETPELLVQTILNCAAADA